MIPLLGLTLAFAQDAADPTTPVDEVRAVFARVDRFRAVDIERDGPVVRLDGTVPTLEARDEVAALADGLPDVAFVDNLVVVDPGPPGSRERRREDVTVEEGLRGVFTRVEELQGIEVRVDGGVAHLSGTVLDTEPVERAEELARSFDGVLWVDNQLEATTDVRERLQPAVERSKDQLADVVSRLPLVAIAGALVMFAWWLAGAVSTWEALLRRVSRRPLVRSAVSGLVWAAILLAGVLLALELLHATSLVGAVIGTAGVFGLAVGFAFQDIVENYLAGLLLAVQQPFGKDDFIEVSGIKGSVVRLTSRNTLLLSVDGNHVFLPNAAVFKGQLTNYTRNPQRRFDFVVGVGYDEDLSTVIDTARRTLIELTGVAADPAPSVHLDNLGDSSVAVHVYGWVDQTTHSFFAVKTEALRRIKEVFEAEGYDMPEPIYRVNMMQSADRERRPLPSREPAVDLRPVDELRSQRERERRAHADVDLLDDEAPDEASAAGDSA